MITRRYYRSGESEFYINKQSARLRDINELFMDTGLGREGYSNIGQGRIDEILSLKSADRREIFEEAAGISKYRHRKEETEHRLAKTDENLLRIGDKITELELQVEPLRQQAEKAKKYLAYRDELKGLQVTLWLQQLDKLTATARKAEQDLRLRQLHPPPGARRAGRPLSQGRVPAAGAAAAGPGTGGPAGRRRRPGIGPPAAGGANFRPAQPGGEYGIEYRPHRGGNFRP